MIAILPTINAALNATAAVLLVWGLVLIRGKRIQQHRRVMKAAFVTSCLFLACYLVYHAVVGSVRFPHTGAIRTVYLSILTTHTILAITIVPLLDCPFSSVVTWLSGADLRPLTILPPVTSVPPPEMIR